MTAELPTAFRLLAWRLIPLACLLLFVEFAVAQTANYCEPSAAVKEDFRKLAQIEDENPFFRARRERQLTFLQELLKKYPGDFHVQRRYRRFVSAATSSIANLWSPNTDRRW